MAAMFPKIASPRAQAPSSPSPTKKLSGRTRSRRRSLSVDPDADAHIRVLMQVLITNLQGVADKISGPQDVAAFKTETKKIITEFQGHMEVHLKEVDMMGKKLIVMKKLQAQVKALKQENQELQKQNKHINEKLSVHSLSQTVKPHAEDKEDLPPALRNYEALTSDPEIVKFFRSEELAQASKNLAAEPTSASCQEKLLTQLNNVTKVFQSVLGKRMREPMIAIKCREVVKHGNRAFREVYTTLWATIQENEADNLEEYCAVTGTLKFPPKRVLQKTKKIVQLYCAAAKIKPTYDKIVADIVSGLVDSKSIELHKLNIPKGLKKIPRILEKTLMRGADPPNCDEVSDVVRGMVVVLHMDDVTNILRAMYNCKLITLTRMKERFERRPSDGGWDRDFSPIRAVGFRNLLHDVGQCGLTFLWRAWGIFCIDASIFSLLRVVL